MLKKSNFIKTIGLSLITLSLLFGILIPAGSVYAKTERNVDIASPTSAVETDFPNNDFLEKSLQRQKEIIEKIGEQIEKSGDLKDKAKERITELKIQGKNVTALEEMLKRYDEILAEARLSYQKAKDASKLHKGFNEKGTIVDVQLGKETVREIESEIRKCRADYFKARRTIVSGIFRFRQNNPAQPKSSY